MKKFIYIACLIVGIILLDTAQALVFDNAPIIGLQTKGMKKEGLFVNTYYCNPDEKYTVLKGVKLSCPYKEQEFTFVDKTKEDENFVCDTALQNFFEDENYVYYWDCVKDEYMIVRYENGKEMTISESLKNHQFGIEKLDEAGIQYIKNEKQKVELQSPPNLYLYIKGDDNKAKALLGTYSWKLTKCGVEEMMLADSLHSTEMRYNDENILIYNDSTIYIESENALISSVNIYYINKTDKIKKISFDNNTIMLGSLQPGEYVLEIIAHYPQGDVCYGIKLISQ